MILVDLLILVILGLYAFFGYRRGFIAGMAELVGFFLGLAIAFAVYKPLGGLVFDNLHFPRGLADMFAFIIIWTLVELAVSISWRHAQGLVPKEARESPANRYAGVIPSTIRGIMLITIAFLILAVAPVPASAKAPFVNSTFGKAFLGVGTAFEQQFNRVFGQAFKDTLAFKTIKQGSDESSQLGFTSANPKLCVADEQKMLALVNQERRKIGLKPLASDEKLRDVGRAHSKDMLARGYFSHNTPEGVDPFERMDAAGITYRVEGENLAFAPTVDVAHTGLMNSPGHRANILKKDYTHVGIGCQDAGIRGKMFSQEFGGN